MLALSGTACKAWVNFNGSGTVAIRDSFNVDSITDNGAGDYTVNFTDDMNNTNYCVVGSAAYHSSYQGQNVRLGTTGSTSMLVGSAEISVTNAGNSAETDSEVVCVMFFGN